MATSFIKINNTGFWAKDPFVEAMQLCLINEIENQKLDSIDWIRKYKCKIALESVPMIYGGMSMALEEYLTTNERKAQIVELIDIIITRIGSTDNYITGSNLHEFRKRAMTVLLETGELEFKNQREFNKIINDSRWNESVGIVKVKDRYQHAFKLLKLLINGEMKTTTSSPADYWNC